jgi:hypothetical protein
MWVFAVTGFYSIACAQKPDGSIDRQTVMVRARCRQHLQNLKTRFPELSGAEIATWPNRDYRFRLIISKIRLGRGSQGPRRGAGVEQFQESGSQAPGEARGGLQQGPARRVGHHVPPARLLMRQVAPYGLSPNRA